MQGALTADEAVAQINQQMQEAFDG
jgi:hypothetical protein